MGSMLDPEGFVPQESPPISKAALTFYLQGMETLRRDSFSYEQAIDFFRRAMAIDSSAVLPQIALAEAYTARYAETNDVMSLTAAEALLQAALPAHPELPELHATLGNVMRVQGRMMPPHANR